MSSAPNQPTKSDWLYQVCRSFGMWLTHLVAGIALLLVMLWVIPDFEEICTSKEWPIPQVTTKIFWESQQFQNYLWLLSPIVALADLALLIVLNVAGKLLADRRRSLPQRAARVGTCQHQFRVPDGTSGLHRIPASAASACRVGRTD